MSRLKAANNAQTALAALMDASATTCTVVNGDILPAVPFRASIDNEIIEVGAKTGNNLSSILRGQEGTTAAAHQSGSLVEASMTAGMYNELNAILNNFTATTDPTANDGSDDGYSVGSAWVNTSTPKAFTCLDATVGSAVWSSGGGDSEALEEHIATAATAGDLGHVKVGNGLAIASGILSAPGLKIVTATHDASVVGDQIITGVGFAPRAVIILAAIGGTAGASIGIATSSARSCLYNYHYATSNAWDAHTSVLAYILTASGVYCRVTSCAFNADGCVLTWAKSSSPTGTVTLILGFLP